MAKHRKTIQNDPLDALVSPTPDAKEETVGSDERAPVAKLGKKLRLTVHLPPDLIDRAKNVVYWTPGLTLAGLAEQALSDAVDARERDHGQPFPTRTEELKGGRPLK